MENNIELSEGAKILIEDLADLEHQQWSHIIKHIFHMNNLELSEKMNKWIVQANTNYKDLSEEDKEKDREWAKKVLRCQWNSANKELERRKDETNNKL